MCILVNLLSSHALPKAARPVQGQRKHQQHALAHAGYKSVAHYLVLTHQAGAALPDAGSAAAAAPVEVPDGAPVGNVIEAAPGEYLLSIFLLPS